MRFLLTAMFVLLSNLSYATDATKDDHKSELKIQAGDKQISFSGYVDGYYANDFNHPIDGNKDFDNGGGRLHTSNPLHDRQYSFGYGFFQVEFDHKNVGYRFATHFGDVVKKMYKDEPDSIKNIREASINIKLNDVLLLEVGYMPSIFGFETFINKDNLHAARAPMTDFAPDFDAGVRLYWKKSTHETFKFQVTNGWQVLRDSNDSQALGAAYVYEKPKEILFNWGMFLGDEAANHNRSSYRYYNNLFAKIHLGKKWILAPMLDLGWEQKVKQGRAAKPWMPWQSYGFSARYAFTPHHGLAGRVDHTHDPQGIIPELKTSTRHGWQATGYTLTYEYLFNKYATFRVEGRYAKSRDAVYKTNHSGKFSTEERYAMTQMGVSF